MLVLHLHLRHLLVLVFDLLELPLFLFCFFLGVCLVMSAEHTPNGANQGVIGEKKRQSKSDQSIIMLMSTLNMCCDMICLMMLLLTPDVAEQSGAAWLVEQEEEKQQVGKE